MFTKSFGWRDSGWEDVGKESICNHSLSYHQRSTLGADVFVQSFICPDLSPPALWLPGQDP